MTHPINRRTFLRGAGAMISLPFLEAMQPLRAASVPAAVPRRMVAINTNLGILERHLFPETAGRGYGITPYLETIKDYRDDFTIISGSSHPDVTGGHSAESSFLTAAPHPGSASFKNSISLDQLAAETIGQQTRVSCLPLIVASRPSNQSLSFTRSGVMLPAEHSPAAVFRALFISGNDKDVERQIHKLRVGGSILDAVGDRAASLARKLGNTDKDRLKQYFESVREVERRLVIAEEWERKPKPKVDREPVKDYEYLPDKLESMYDLIHLAIATDSTRLITMLIKLDGFSQHIPGVKTESHTLSHHINRADKLQELKNLETVQFQALAKLLKRLKETDEAGESLLDRTMLLYGSNLGNANNHDNKNLPVIFAGGGFKHGQHLAFNRAKNYPLPNLYVSMLQRLGVEADQFASSTGTMEGLEFKS